MNSQFDNVLQDNTGGFQVLKRMALSAVVFFGIGTAPALAQPRVEAGINFGWVFSDGVSGGPVTAEGQIYDRLDPKDSGSWGFHIGGLVGEGAEVGFMYSHQFSTLVAGGTRDKELGDLGINNYHGYFGYNFGSTDATVRPYFFGGAGATSFSSVDYTRVGGQTGTIQGTTNFSTTWGLGVKAFPSPAVGVRFGVQWTPTYIKSDSEGWWCDPWWGCYLVGDSKYSNQFEFSGGVVFRFGGSN